MTVLCYGGICIDNIIHVPYMPTPGVATTPTRQHFQLGGGATQTALWLAQWGVAVAISGNGIGEDEYGRQIRNSFAEYPALDTRYILQSPHIDTPYTRAMIPPDGDRYLFEFGYDKAPMFPVNEIDFAEIQIATVNYYYNNPETESQRLAQQAHKNGVSVVASDILTVDNPFIAVADVLINSRAVMQKVLPDSDHPAYSRELQAKMGGIVIMTDGDSPVYAIDCDGTILQVDVPQVAVLDTTGAGDAFRAGIIYGMLNQWELARSLRLAVAAGALQVQRDAAIQAPATLEETMTLAETIAIESK